MLIKNYSEYYSVEDVIKFNVISESRSGRVWLHMHTFLKNQIKLVIETEKFTYRHEVNNINVNYTIISLYTSPNRQFDIRSGLKNTHNPLFFFFQDVSPFFIPVTGKFEFDDGRLNTHPDSNYQFLFKEVAFSRRYITDEQLKEIRKYSLHNIEWEYDEYIFGRIEELKSENVKFRFKFFNMENMRKYYSLFTSNNLFKNADRKFFLKKEVDGKIVAEEVSV